MAKPRWVRWLIHLDVFANVRLLNGWHGETISSRCGKAQYRSIRGIVEEQDELWLTIGWYVDCLFFWDKGWHCIKHIQFDVGRAVYE